MHDVAELVEVRFHLVVLQERRGVGRRFAEVGHHGRHRHLACAVRQQTAGLQAEAGGVAVLPLPARTNQSIKLYLYNLFKTNQMHFKMLHKQLTKRTGR